MLQKVMSLSLRSKYTIFLMCIFNIALFIRDVNDIPIPRIFFILVTALIFCATDFKYIIAFVSFLFPSSAGLPFFEILALAMVFGVPKIRSSIRINTWLLVCALLILMRETYAFFSLAFVSMPILALNYYLLFFFPCVFIPSCYKKIDYPLVLKAYLLGTFFMATNIFFQYVSVYGLADFLELGVRIGDTRTALGYGAAGLRVSNNQNVLGVLCSTALYVFLILNYKKLLPAYYAFLIPFIIGFGLLTQSRAFMLALVVIFAYYIVAVILENKKNNIRSISSIAVPIATAVLCFVAFFHFLPQFADNLMGRLETDDITGGRGDIINYFNSFLLNNPRFLFFGAGGIQGYRQYAGTTFGAHNGLQQVLLTWGVAGLSVVGVIMYHLYKAAVAGSKLEFLGFLPIFMYFWNLMTFQWFSSATMLLLNMIWFCTIKVLVVNVPDETLRAENLYA